MTIAELELRVRLVEKLIHGAKDPKDLPSLNETYRLLTDRLVTLDLAGLTEEPQKETK